MSKKNAKNGFIFSPTENKSETSIFFLQVYLWWKIDILNPKVCAKGF